MVANFYAPLTSGPFDSGMVAAGGFVLSRPWANDSSEAHEGLIPWVLLF